MKTKLVLWGTDDQEQKVLMAIQLRAEDNQVDVWTFHGENATNDLHKQLLYEWREGKEMAFPESGYNHHEGELSATGRLLPENVFPEKDELIERAKTEWHFVVLSSKLNEVYQIELTELREKIEGTESYSSEKWDELKVFWDKVREQMQENNLARDHANSLKRQVNSLFSYLKDLRSAQEAEFQANSASTYDKFNKSLEEVNARIQKGEMLHLVFEELKSIQREFRSTQLTREDRAKLWPKIDGAFKAVKERRFGPSSGGGGGGNSPIDRHQHRLTGLMEAITKMERSIQRDKEDLNAQERKKGSTSIGQLESQLLDAKINIIRSRFKSKEDKLKNMHKTREEVEKKIADAKRRKEERAAKAEEKAKAKAVAPPVESVDNKVDKAKISDDAADTATVEVPADVAKAVKEAPAEVAKTVEVPADVAKAVEEAPAEVAKTVEVPADVAKAVKEAPAEVAKTVEVPADVAKAVEEAPAEVAKTVEVPADVAKAVEEAPAEVAKTVEVPADVAKAVEEAPIEVVETIEIPTVKEAETKVEAAKEEVAEVVEEAKTEVAEKVEELAKVAEEPVKYETAEDVAGKVEEAVNDEKDAE